MQTLETLTPRHAIPETGNPFIDAAHRRLMMLGETIRDAWRLGGDTQKFLAGIDAFHTAVIEHFGQEELILKAIRFENAQTHHQNHVAILEMLEQAISRLHQAWEIETIARVVELMEDILLCHELVDDNDFIDLMSLHLEEGATAGLLAWNANLETGSEVVDAGHRQLITALNQVYALCRAGKEAEAEAGLDAFEAQICQHFRDEEARLEPKGSDGARQRRSRHQQMLGDLQRVNGYRREGSLPLQAILEGYLRFWLLNHIRQEDVPEFLARLHVARPHVARPHVARPHVARPHVD